MTAENNAIGMSMAMNDERNTPGRNRGRRLVQFVLIGILCPLGFPTAVGDELQPPSGTEALVRPLIRLQLDDAFDLSRLDGRLSIVGHYFETTDGRRDHYLLAIPVVADWQSTIDASRAIVLDDDSKGKTYLWVTARNLTNARLVDVGARVLATRSGGATSLLRTTRDGEQIGEVVAWIRRLSPEAVRVSVIDIEHGIRSSWIQKATIDATASRLAALPARTAPDPAIKALIDGVDPAACQVLMSQLTGGTSIRSGDADVVVRSRFATHPDMAVLTTWLCEELELAGCDASIDSFTSPIHPSHGLLPQVIATIPGSDLADELVLLTAHLDAVRNTVGGDDNASGVAAIVTAMKRLASERGRFRRTIRLLAFNDEEQGLIGSADYARRLRESDTKVVAVLNLDMVAFDKDGDRRIQLQSNGTSAADILNDGLVAAAATYGLDVKPIRVVDPEESSDYASFWRVGYPAINIGDEYFLCDEDCVSPPRRGVGPPEGDFTPCYHQPCDRVDADGFQADLIVETAKLVIATAAEIAERTPDTE